MLPYPAWWLIFPFIRCRRRKTASKCFGSFENPKPGGLLVTANPTHSYDAEQIIRSSLMQLQNEGKPWVVKKFGVYPLTLHLGLKHIERQLRAGRWHGYQPDELLDEVAQAGFTVAHSETVYGGSGYLVVGKKDVIDQE